MAVQEETFTPNDADVLKDLARYATGMARARGTSPKDRVAASKAALFFSKKLEEIGEPAVTTLEERKG